MGAAKGRNPVTEKSGNRKEEEEENESRSSSQGRKERRMSIYEEKSNLKKVGFLFLLEI